MNKARILGISLIIIGIVLDYSFDNDGTDFAFGFLISAGLILTIAGRFRFKSKIQQNREIPD
jgi:hypothetical protein